MRPSARVCWLGCGAYCDAARFPRPSARERGRIRNRKSLPGSGQTRPGCYRIIIVKDLSGPTWAGPELHEITKKLRKAKVFYVERYGGPAIRTPGAWSPRMQPPPVSTFNFGNSIHSLSRSPNSTASSSAPVRGRPAMTLA